MAVVRNVDSRSQVSSSGELLAFSCSELRFFVDPFSFPCLLVVPVRVRFVFSFFRLRTFPSSGSYEPDPDSTGTRNTFVALALASGT